MDTPKYRAFISYSHRDARWASWLHTALETYRPPKLLVGKVTARGEVPKRLTPIFKDREELPSAVDLGGLVNAARGLGAGDPQPICQRWSQLAAQLGGIGLFGELVDQCVFDGWLSAPHLLKAFQQGQPLGRCQHVER